MAALRAARLIGQSIADRRRAYVQVHGRWLVNFTSTDYLGLGSHPVVLRAAEQAIRRRGVSLGMPRVIGEDVLTAQVERRLARLVGQEEAVVFPSTRHLALDLLPLLAGPDGVVLVDEWAYPLSKEGAHAAVRQGAKAHEFPHDDWRRLNQLLTRHAESRRKVIVCDGVYAAGGGLAPLGRIFRLAVRSGALVYVDDAHGLGVYGRNPSSSRPYGTKGCGTPCYFGGCPGNVIHVATLGKAFGVPIAFAAGPSRVVGLLRKEASTHTHSSPPATATLAAADAVLRVHGDIGDGLRRRLRRNVLRFSRRMREAGIMYHGSAASPIRTLQYDSARAALATGTHLVHSGVWPLVQFHPPDHPSGGVVRFIVTASHSDQDLTGAVRALSRGAGRTRNRPSHK